ncbi:hypothetical protein F5I97DRAFT_1104230 [Phlebopus sp. FC_14]|nr:hypothetical protein F5I97DRAFT_1104230 [Phlebopus sp. FC_14]
MHAQPYHRRTTHSRSPEQRSSVSPPNHYPIGPEQSDRPPRQNKTMLQRQYREKEGESFNLLRDTIKELTNEEPQTRYDVLTKATQLLRELGRENARLRQSAAATTGSYMHAPASAPPLSPTHSQFHDGSPLAGPIGGAAPSSPTSQAAPPWGGNLEFNDYYDQSSQDVDAFQSGTYPLPGWIPCADDELVSIVMHAAVPAHHQDYPLQQHQHQHQHPHQHPQYPSDMSMLPQALEQPAYDLYSQPSLAIPSSATRTAYYPPAHPRH